ncbi:MAG: hyperosmotically inducible protein [Pseudohongiellaceae bacterium]|jgi:hyperosmotically inducible protein
MKKLIEFCAIPLFIAVAATSAFAQHSEQNSALQDAWLDGKLGAIVVLNEHLNSLQIETDVVDGTATIIGEVDSSAQKYLMTELATGVEGIHSVHNRLQITAAHNAVESGDDTLSVMLDASITTAISAKLLLNSAIDSSEINVDTQGQEVKLEGRVNSEIESELTQQIAQNTFEVDSVVNNLQISKQ